MVMFEIDKDNVFYDRIDGDWEDSQARKRVNKTTLTAELKQLIGYLSFIIGQKEGMDGMTSAQVSMLSDISRRGMYDEMEGNFMNTLRKEYLKELSKFYD